MKRKIENKEEEKNKKIKNEVNLEILSDGQKEVIKYAKEGKNLFFTGPAGTGKSFVLKKVIQELMFGLSITAMTGTAAYNIGGSTLHSFAGIGLGDNTAEKYVGFIRRDKRKMQNWIHTKTLIIDEVSMLSSELFEKLEEIARKVRKCEKFFGGIQLILCGDFFQLPPISKDENKVKFCFESDLWKNIKHSITLTEQFRQKEFNLINMLGELRIGKLSSESEELIKSRTNKKIECPEGIVPTKLYTTRKDVNSENQNELNKLKTELITYNAIEKGDEKVLEIFDKMCPSQKELNLKIGAQVMLIVNMDVKEGLVNGSRGVIIDFINNKPLVKFKNQTIIIERYEFEFKKDDKVIATRLQFPLILAWAITVHKSQGMTIDYLIVNLSNVFECGQTYVALSRCSTIDGLSIVGFNKNKIKVHEKVINFNKK